MPLIDLKHIAKTYGKGEAATPVLHDISLSIEPGEFIAISGPSGSGKTTLMNIIGLLDKPNSGNYHLEGEHINPLPDSDLAQLRRQKIGFVFQSFNLLGRLTTQRNIELPMIYNHTRKKARLERTKGLLKIVGLEHRGHHKPNELSGGQMQRVAIARALANNPPILLADEPTGNLDSKTGMIIMRILKKLNQRGTTIVVVTHDQYIAEQANRVIRMVDGKIVRPRSKR